MDTRVGGGGQDAQQPFVAFLGHEASDVNEPWRGRGWEAGSGWGRKGVESAPDDVHARRIRTEGEGTLRGEACGAVDQGGGPEFCGEQPVPAAAEDVVGVGPGGPGAVEEGGEQPGGGGGAGCPGGMEVRGGVFAEAPFPGDGGAEAGEVFQEVFQRGRAVCEKVPEKGPGDVRTVGDEQGHLPE